MALFKRAANSMRRFDPEARQLASKPRRKKLFLEQLEYRRLLVAGGIVEAAPFRNEVVLINTPHGSGTGTFITRQDILTAAHVVVQDQGNPTQIQILTSLDANVMDPNGRGHHSYSGAKVTINPGYHPGFVNGKLTVVPNDLAIIHLSELAEDVIPATITSDPVKVLQLMETVGFGLTGKTNGTLMLDGGVRKLGFFEVLETKNDNTFQWSLEQPDGSVNASGDSGGPAFFIADSVGQGLQAPQLVGVTQSGPYGIGLGSPVNSDTPVTDTQVAPYLPWINQTIALNNAGPEVTVMSQSDITVGGAPTSNLRLQFFNAFGIPPTDPLPKVALIGPNNYYNPINTGIGGLVSRSNDGELLTVDYAFAGPGGTWSSAANGLYTVVLSSDTRGNPTNTTKVTTFSVNVPPDTRPPTASLGGTSGITAGKPNVIVNVGYGDDFGVNAATLGNDDVRLITPGGSSLPGRLMISNTISNATGLYVPYEFAAPGGTWDTADNGNYQIVVQGGAVQDTSGHPIATTVIGTISVNIAPASPIAPWALLSAPDITAPAPQATFTITFHDDVGVDVGSITSLSNNGGVVFGERSLGFVSPATLVSISPNTNASTVVATYQCGQNFTAANNGDYFEIGLFEGTAYGWVTDTSGNRAGSGVLGGFAVRISGGTPNSVAPQALVEAPGISFATNQAAVITALFSDNEAVQAASVTSNSLFVIGPNQQQYPVELTTANFGEDVPMMIATYTMQPPAGSWGQADNGLYQVVVRDGTISDISGNATPGYQPNDPQSGVIGTFTVSVSASVTPAPPEASFNGDTITTATPFHSFTVSYSDSNGVDVSTIGNDNVYVTDSSGVFVGFAQLLSVDNTSNGTSRTATYQIAGPGGKWTSDDNGSFNVYMAGADLGGVKGVDGESVFPGPLGTLQVAINSGSVFSWQNSTKPLDVNNDGIVSALDVEILIHDIDLNGIRTLPTLSGTPANYLDINGDGSIGPLDVVSAISFLDNVPVEYSGMFSGTVINAGDPDDNGNNQDFTATLSGPMTVTATPSPLSGDYTFHGHFVNLQVSNLQGSTNPPDDFSTTADFDGTVASLSGSSSQFTLGLNEGTLNCTTTFTPTSFMGNWNLDNPDDPDHSDSGNGAIASSFFNPEIDKAFINTLENSPSTVPPYEPANTAYLVPGSTTSGATIGTGFDLGRHDEDDIRKLELSPDLEAKIIGSGLLATGPGQFTVGPDAASAMQGYRDTHGGNDFTLDDSEVKELDKAVQDYELNQINAAFSKDSSTPFDLIDPAAQTVLASEWHNAGDLSKVAPKFWGYMTSGNYQAAINELNHWYADGSTDQRHQDEAQYLQDNLKSK
jgi:hypothetical protein